MTEGSVGLDVTIWDPQVTAGQFRLSPLHYGWGGKNGLRQIISVFPKIYIQ